MMRAERGWLKGLNPAVALISMAAILLLVVYGGLEAAGIMPPPPGWNSLFEALSGWIIRGLGWWYTLLVAGVLVFSGWLMFSRAGGVRLGLDDERPAYPLIPWFAMLFAAGMGIGLVFWAVAEPVSHFQDNPFLAPGDAPLAGRTAMRLTLFHWGLHPWAIYGVMAAGFGYFAYRKGLPLTVRSALFPLIGARIYGPIGHAADIIAVFATTVGVATSLGLGAAQVNAGLNYLFGVSLSAQVQLVIIIIITAMATTSVVSGLDRGIKLLSQINIWLAALLLVFVAVVGPTATLLNAFVQNTGDYLQNLIYLSLWTDAWRASGWRVDWTVFYWAWWISWAPFVGMFIARISRGRTIRELMLGVLIAPTLVTFVWLTVMGGAALSEIMAGDPAGIAAAVRQDVSLSLYALIDALAPGWIGAIFALIAMVLVVLFFVTSSDSGTLVTTTILSLGDPDPPVGHRLFWGVAKGATAAVLLAVGGLAALQAAAISAALPFSIVMAAMGVGLARSLHREAPRPKLHKDPPARV